MVELETPLELMHFVGLPIGVSPWVTVDQNAIDNFANATGDHQWIHVDVERAKRERVGGRTIAHGLLILSLIPHLSQSIFIVKSKSLGIFGGLNLVRFTRAVPSGARIRLSQKVKSVEMIDKGVRVISECIIEIEGDEVPALFAETLSEIYDQRVTN
jgi:acyl dehydratase